MRDNCFNRISLASAAVGIAATLALSSSVSAEGADSHHKVVPAEEITFEPGPGTLPPGVQFAVLVGSPAEEGPFVLRLKFPAGYVVPPHMHPEEEHVTVVSGEFRIGNGNVFEKSAVSILQPGSFVQIGTGMPHFAWVAEETVVQINAMGPFGITYVNEEDDPRIN